MRYVVVVLGILAAMICGIPSEHVTARAQAGIATTSAHQRRYPRPAPTLAGRVNSVTLTNKSGVAISGYPLQFGRPFVDRAIPHAPQVLIDGNAAASQADVKNRYPDGSVEFAVMAVVVPSIPAQGSETLTFGDTTASGNTALTSAQMLDRSYNFDAALTFTPNRGSAQTADARTMLQNGDYKLWTSGPVAQTIILADDSTAAKYDIGFGDGHKPLRPRFYATFWPATHQVFVRAVVESANPQQVEDAAYRVVITAGAAAPATVYSADLSGRPPPPHITGLRIDNAAGYPATYTGAIILAGAPSSPLPNGTHFTALIGSEAVELSQPSVGRFILWTRGLGGTTRAALTNGESVAASRGWPKMHWALTSWTKEFWLGGTPSPEVTIDNSLAYLASTRFVPNYDASIVVTPAALTAQYASWTSHPHDIYDGVWDGGIWQNIMGNVGARPDIGPYPTWNALWLYGGDWRMRQFALGMADLASSWPAHLRESDPARVGPARGGAGGGGLGLPVSIVGRPGLFTVAGDMVGDSTPPDGPTVVGAGYNVSADPWSGFQGAHQPAPFYVPYLLTGDPWYLGEAEMWASFSAAFYPNNGLIWGRGPDGTYGAVNDELRGWAWVSRNRGEAAFIAPDNDPMKGYLTELMNDNLARMYGALGLTGTGYDGTAMYAWGAATGFPYTNNLGPNTGKVPPLHNWESLGDPAGTGANLNSLVLAEQNAGIFVPGAAGSITSPWMQWYVQYALGRLTELGFDTDQLSQWTGQYLIGMIDSAYPQAISMYEIPVEQLGGGFYPTYTALYASLEPAYLTGIGWNAALGNTLSQYFAIYNMQPQGYVAYAEAGLAPLVDEGAPGAAQAWQWMHTNVYQPIAASASPWSSDPSWAIVPRTDTNALPPQPTAPQ
jgi:hypothetical protein